MYCSRLTSKFRLTCFLLFIPVFIIVQFSCASSDWDDYHEAGETPEVTTRSEDQIRARRNSLRKTIKQKLPVSEVLWSNSHRGIPYRNIWMGRDLIYVELTNNQLWAIKRSSGKTAWFYSLDRRLETKPVPTQNIPERRSKVKQNLATVKKRVAEEKSKLQPKTETIQKLEQKRRRLKRNLSRLNTQDRLYFVENGNELHIINRMYGTTIPDVTANTSLDFTPSAPPLATPDLLVIPGYEDRRVHFLNTVNFFKKSTFSPAKAVTSQPSYTGASVLFSAQDGHLYQYNDDDQSIRTAFQAEGSIHSRAIVHQNNIYLGSADMQVYSLDRSTKNIEWTIQTQASITQDLQVRSPNVYASPENKGLIAINLNTGKRKWTFQNCTRYLAEGEKRIYCTDQTQNQIHAIAKDNGTHKNSYNTKFADKLLTNKKSSIFYLATDDGLLFAAKASPFNSPFQ